MAERGGVPVRRLAVGLRSHLAAAIADRAYTVIQSTCEAYAQIAMDGWSLIFNARVAAHQIRSAHQLIRLWQVDPCKISMPIRRCLPCSSVGINNCCSGKKPGY
eukprot:4117506-Pleurochrysis_carterae.AAC.1